MTIQLKQTLPEITSEVKEILREAGVGEDQLEWIEEDKNFYMMAFIYEHMRPVKVDGWTVYSTVDEFGRRGSLQGVYSCKVSAEEAAVGIGWYGEKGEVLQVSLMKVGDEHYQLASPEPIDLDLKKKISDADLREKTIASLAPEQRRVLGLE